MLFKRRRLFRAIPGANGRDGENLKIVAQAIENLPAGPVNVGIDQRTALPTKRMVYSTIEGLISHFELEMSNRGFEVPHEESYGAIEAPNGELGFYIVGDGSDRRIGLVAARRRTFTLRPSPT